MAVLTNGGGQAADAEDVCKVQRIPPLWVGQRRGPWQQKARQRKAAEDARTPNASRPPPRAKPTAQLAWLDGGAPQFTIFQTQRTQIRWVPGRNIMGDPATTPGSPSAANPYSRKNPFLAELIRHE